jgi:hypothetical protein
MDGVCQKCGGNVEATHLISGRDKPHLAYDDLGAFEKAEQAIVDAYFA